MQEVAPGIFVETSYSPYNLGLITLDNGVLVIDIPPRATDAARWLSQVQEFAGPVRYAVLTNAIPERLVAAAMWDVPLIAEEQTARAITEKDDKEWHELFQNIGKRYPEESSIFSSLKPHRVTLAFNQHFILHRRTPSVEFRAVHNVLPGSLWVFVPDHGILFAGDTVVIDYVPIMDLNTDCNVWLKLLMDLEEQRNVRRIISGRGQAIVRPGALAEQQELLKVATQTAQKLAKHEDIASELSRTARELVLAFFPHTQRQPEKLARIKQLLETMVTQIRPPVDPEEED